ncbi:MAG: hypothetical protein O2960_26420 [Verrucomicrobia bacterium]|nr:hypothetical protein [Verrucomicrobiota bacterium]
MKHSLLSGDPSWKTSSIATTTRLLFVLPILVVLFQTACFTNRTQSRERDLTEDTPEGRAVAFLAGEVARWPKENGCFSCHNNGDAARALYLAEQSGFHVSKSTLESTTDWLVHPERWDKNKGDPGFSDKCLARVQFAAAALSAIKSGVLADKRFVFEASALVAECQAADGAWRVIGSESIGSPVTYGNLLLTHMALRTLREALSIAAVEKLSGSKNGIDIDPASLSARIRRAEDWLKKRPILTILDSAAILMALDPGQDSDSQRQHSKALALIQAGQSENGGWGPYVTAPPEVFDTALVILALKPFANSAEMHGRLARARQYLISRQEADGGWPETTRPSGGESYAQRLSTSGWAALALIELARP